MRIDRRRFLKWSGILAVASVFLLSGIAFSADGDLDTTFGTNGTVIANITVYADYGNGVAIQSDGKIVVTGATYDIADYNYDVFVLRYNTDGTPDTTFGTGGSFSTMEYSGMMPAAE